MTRRPVPGLHRSEPLRRELAARPAPSNERGDCRLGNWPYTPSQAAGLNESPLHVAERLGAVRVGALYRRHTLCIA
jgi:hypothetical protein